MSGFTRSAVMILVSEIGDKTFFIAAIMAMRHPQLTARSARDTRNRQCVFALRADAPPPGAGRRAERAVGHDGAVSGDGVGSAGAGARRAAVAPLALGSPLSRRRTRAALPRCCAAAAQRTHCRQRSRVPAGAQMSPTLTHHAATALFFFFGLRTLYQSTVAWEGGESELAEARAPRGRCASTRSSARLAAAWRAAAPAQFERCACALTAPALGASRRARWRRS